MPHFNEGIRTEAGQNLFGLVDSGKTMIHYTKVVYSSLDLSDKTDNEISQMTDVQPQELVIPNPSVLFRPKTTTTDPETEIRAYGDNQHLNKGFYINTYALYASGDDGHEILLGVTCDDHPSWLPAYDGVRPQGLSYNWDINNKNGKDNVHFTDAHDEYATYGDYQTFSEAVGSQLNSAVNHASSYAGTTGQNLLGSVSTNSSNITNLRSSANSISGNISEDEHYLGIAISGYGNDIASASNSNRSNSLEIAKMNGQLSNVADNTSVSTAINNVSNATNSLSGSVSSNSSNISSVTNEVNSVANSDIPNLSIAVSNNSSNVNSLSSNMNQAFLVNPTPPGAVYAFDGVTLANAIDVGSGGLSYAYASENGAINYDVGSIPNGAYINNDIEFLNTPKDINSYDDNVALFSVGIENLLIDFTKMIIYMLDSQGNQTKLFDASQQNNSSGSVDLSGYLKSSDFASALNNYLSNNNLDGYVKQSDLDNDLSNIPTNDSLNSYETQSDTDNKLANYVTESDLSQDISNVSQPKHIPIKGSVDMNNIPDGTYLVDSPKIIHCPANFAGCDVQIFSNTDKGGDTYQRIINYDSGILYIRSFARSLTVDDGQWYIFHGNLMNS